jgi:hypothetical protein
MEKKKGFDYHGKKVFDYFREQNDNPHCSAFVIMSHEPEKTHQQRKASSTIAANPFRFSL